MKNGKCTTDRLSMGVKYCLVIICTLFLFSVYAGAQEKDLTAIRNEVERRYLSSSDFELILHKGNYRIQRGEVVDADIIITGGDIEIDGEVLGTVITIEGDIEVGRTGTIMGDAIAVSGDIIRSSGSAVVGDEIQTSWRNFVNRRDRSLQSRPDWRDDRFSNWNRPDWEDDLMDEDFIIRYNRVEGLFLGGRITNPDWGDGRLLYLYGEGGYGFKSEDWRYTIGLERRFFDDHFLSIGVKAYDLTDSDDFWRIGKNENWLAASIIKEDFFDYYNRRGHSAYISQQIDNIAKFQLEYRIDRFENMPLKASWSLFGGRKKFRDNPAIVTGDMRSINFYAIFDSRERTYRSNQGFFARFDTEYTSPDLESDFDYERYILDLRSYVPLSRYENLNVRLMLGSSRGALPPQRGFYIGGIGTLRGLKFKEFPGTSMAMGNIEYVFDPYRLLTGPPSWFLEDFRISLFTDIGAVDFVELDDYWDMMDKDIWKHDVGFGILSQDEDARLDFAWRTDKQGEPLRVTFRINRTF
ncbi:BamA/TamA family outer membrane protein [candidate division KSB1 bacterium]